MENMATITTRDGYYLVNSKTPYQRRRRVARLLCHEVRTEVSCCYLSLFKKKGANAWEKGANARAA
eukprot:scaffold7392_cov286-Pinguiococcus_pyrenoidosus.AAC.17